MILRNNNPEMMWRFQLLKKCFEMDISENTMVTISGAIKNSEDKENLAKRILEAISDETEDEAIRAKAMQVING